MLYSKSFINYVLFQSIHGLHPDHIAEHFVHILMTSSDRLSYITGLDGIRAVAVMAVLFYHADFPWALGGFLGVETFFVLSGFLITALLLAEWQSTNRINLKHFWLRRARRLLPAVWLLLLALPALASGICTRCPATLERGYSSCLNLYYELVVHCSRSAVL